MASTRVVAMIEFFRRVARDCGFDMRAEAKVLDFGCGDGMTVTEWRAAGFDAYGCDIVLEEPSERLRLIEQPYRLPFEDATFDLIVSNEVFEHVQEMDVAFSEIRRTLKPGGLSVHRFPARWNPIEVHTLVPLASVIPRYRWIALWALLGVRNRFQKGKPWRDVALLNTEFLKTRTNYPSRRTIRRVAAQYFPRVEFAETLALKHGHRSRALYPVARAFPPIAWVYGAMRARLLVLC
jgi:SAM-dependent methyltransferase